MIVALGAMQIAAEEDAADVSDEILGLAFAIEEKAGRICFPSASTFMAIGMAGWTSWETAVGTG